jgi:outer membrane protein assembly factor BamB
MSIMAPQKEGDFLFASGIGNVAALLKLGSDSPTAEVAWRGQGNTSIYCSNSTPVIVDGVMYGTDCRAGSLRATEFETGKRLWETYDLTASHRPTNHGTVFLVRTGDRFFLFSETGDLAIARLSAEKYEEISRAHLIEPTGEAFGRPVVWTHPAFANRHAFIRNDKELICVSLAAE